MKPALVALLSIGAVVSQAQAQTVPTPVSPRPVRAAELDLVAAGSALIALAGVVAIMRGRRRG